MKKETVDLPVSRATRTEVRALGKIGDTYDDAVRKLLDTYYMVYHDQDPRLKTPPAPAPVSSPQAGSEASGGVKA